MVQQPNKVDDPSCLWTNNLRSEILPAFASSSVWNDCKLYGKSGLLQVYKGIKDGVHDVAIKIFKSVSTARDLELLQTEIAVLRSCNNRNIVHFYGVSFKGSDAWLVMELLEKGNLYNALAYGRGLCTWYNRYCLYSFLSVSPIHVFRPVMLLH